MARITVTERDEYGEQTLAWFEDSKADWLAEDTRWDGENHVGVVSGAQSRVGTQTLWRTAGGRWVLEVDSTRWQGGRVTREFITEDQARDWLIRDGSDGDRAAEAWLARYFGDLAEESGPGRPQVGTRIGLVVPDDLLARAGEVAAVESVTRAEVLRRWLAAGAVDAAEAGR